MSKEFQQDNRGFSLLEVVVALGLLIMVFGGVTGLAILSTEAAKSSKNNLIAGYLAKEAQEIVRYKRDLNYLLAVPPFTDIADTTSDNAVQYYKINYDGTITTTTDAEVENAAVLEIASNFYAQSAGTDTIFRRLVTTTYHAAAGPLPAYIDVLVEVYWNDDTRRNTYTLQSELTDWR